MSMLFPSSDSLTRQESSKWTFSKSERFPKLAPMPPGVAIMPVASLGKKGTSLGFGSKWSPGGRSNSPSPDSYSLPSTFNSKRAEHSTIGTPLSKLPSLKPSPGPASYTVSSPLGNNAPKVSFGGRHTKNRNFRELSPSSYNPNRRLTQNTQYAGVSFGFGERIFLRKFNKFPGPGSYSLDKNSKNRSF